MKATDLMLNDLVLYRGEVAKVIGITANGEVSLLVDGHIVARFVYAEELSPIPLTPEILEKNGFKKDAGGEECWTCKMGWFTPHKYNRKFIPVSWEVEICGKPNSFDGIVKCVHELQHALKLCGIEKEITL